MSILRDDGGWIIIGWTFSLLVLIDASGHAKAYVNRLVTRLTMHGFDVGVRAHIYIQQIDARAGGRTGRSCRLHAQPECVFCQLASRLLCRFDAR